MQKQFSIVEKGEIINVDISERIAHEVIRTLYSRFLSFPDDDQTINMNRNAPFHEAFLNAFSDRFSKMNISNPGKLITLSSWLHGLNTTLGQSFFENVAQIISDGEKRDFTEITLYTESQNKINEIISDLKNGQHNPNMIKENELIFNSGNKEELKAPQFTADLYVETNKEIKAYELKSVRPNSGEMRGEKEKILRGKAYLKKENPHKDVYYYLCVPYDPTETENETAYDKERYMRYSIEFNKFIAADELLLSSEFWNHLSGKSGTMEYVLNIIRKIAKPDFFEKYCYINKPENIGTEKYKHIAQEWFLKSEVKISQNIDKLYSIAEEDKKLQKDLHKTSFKKGEYNFKRSEDLKKNI